MKTKAEKEDRFVRKLADILNVDTADVDAGDEDPEAFGNRLAGRLVDFMGAEAGKPHTYKLKELLKESLESVGADLKDRFIKVGRMSGLSGKELEEYAEQKSALATRATATALAEQGLIDAPAPDEGKAERMAAAARGER